MRELEGRIALITGGTSGIGSCTAEYFAKAGAVVCIIGRSPEKAEAVTEKIHLCGGRSEYFLCDITSEEDVNKTFEKIKAYYGRIDILFNSAGISPVGTVRTTAFSDFKKVMEIDLYSIFLTSKAAISHMEDMGGGSIINIAGTYGIRPVPNKAGYSCAKAGVISLTKSIAIDFARIGIRCNAISPGFVETPLNEGFDGEKRSNFLEKYQPADIIIQPEDIAGAALYLASDNSRGVTGQNLIVDGGSEACLYYLHKSKGNE